METIKRDCEGIHDHPMALALVVIICVGIVGGAWFASWAASNWRQTNGRIISIENKSEWIQTICSGKPIHCYPIVHTYTDLHLAYAWNNIRYDSVQYRASGWSWTIGQNITLTVDKESGNIIFCC